MLKNKGEEQHTVFLRYLHLVRNSRVLLGINKLTYLQNKIKTQVIKSKFIEQTEVPTVRLD